MIKESQYIDVARGFVNLLRAFSFLFLGWIKEIKNKERDPVIKKQLQAVLIKVYEMENRDAFLSSIKQLDARGVFLARTLLATSALTILLKKDLLKDEKISESFLHLIGMLVLYEAELLLRARAGEIDLNDDEFRFAYLFPYPNPYILFYYTSKKIEFEEVTKASLRAVQNLAEIATKGIYHPDDPEWTENKKFLSKRRKEVEEPKTEAEEPKTEAKVQKTEAEGLFDELLAVTLHKKLSAFDEKELGEKIFEWDKNLLNLPNSYRRDLYNEIESDLVRRGVTRETLREWNEKIKKLRTLVNKDKDYQNDLQQAEQELRFLITKDIGVVHTGQEDVEGIPTEIEISNDMVQYIYARPDEVVEFIQEREHANNEVRSMIAEYIDSLAPRARSQSNVGDFLYNSNDVGKYINETTGSLKVEEIHEESGVPIRTVKRFCEGFIKYHRKKHKSNLIPKV